MTNLASAVCAPGVSTIKPGILHFYRNYYNLEYSRIKLLLLLTWTYLNWWISPRRNLTHKLLFFFVQKVSSLKFDIQGVPSIGTHFRFQFLTFLIVLSKKSNYAILTQMVYLKFCHLDPYKIPKIDSFFHMLKKIGKKNIFFCAGPPPPPELHIRIVKKI